VLDGQDGCSFNGDNRAWNVSSVTYVGLRHLVERRYLEWDESSVAVGRERDVVRRDTIT